ncbi:TolC family protein [Candidatus Omnitrophota bacterium]
MQIKRIILLYLVTIITVIVIYPSVSLSYPTSDESVTQYILDLSRDITKSIQKSDKSIIYSSRGELVLKLLLSPWGELKDVYISESSGNEELDGLFLKTVWMYDRYQPFPEDLGENELWIDVPIILEIDSLRATQDKVWSYSEDVKTQFIGPEGLGIDEAVDIALENREALKIAHEEMELSNLKIREARRALYPTASLNFLETVGRVSSAVQDFTDKEYKVKFEYPLYYGWRLKYAVDQAVSNMKASKHNYDKVMQDLRIGVETAFYSYIATKSNVRLQRALLDEAEGIFDVAEKRFRLGLTTKAEFLQVESQLNQIIYQVTSSENDMEIAALTLAQAMDAKDPNNLEDLIDIDKDFMDLEPIDISVTLEECMELAYKNRPDKKEKEHMVEFNDYGRKIAKSKDQLALDFTGTYGKSGGAFESETLELDEDWYLGLKVSKPLGGNTLSTTYTKEETSPKHGQSTNTETVSKSVELGLLDNLQSFSEKKSSGIALKKAREELWQVKESIFKEVKETFLNYTKGLVQIRSNINKIRYREEELKITKARSELNEIPSSGLLKAHIDLTDERSFYIEAVGSLYQSLVKLNKATGYALFLDNESFMLANVGKQ